jgi:hypothetical protein
MPTPREALSAAYESWNAGDLDAYLEFYDRASGCTANRPSR